MLQIRGIGKKLGLCDIKIQELKTKRSRKYMYKIEQSESLKVVLIKMLKVVDNKMKVKFKKDLISKIEWDGMKESVNWYLEGCMINDED